MFKRLFMALLFTFTFLIDIPYLLLLLYNVTGAHSGQEPVYNVTANELKQITKEIFEKAVSESMVYTDINFQAKIMRNESEDHAPLPLFTIRPELYANELIVSFLVLLDNYDVDVHHKEHLNPQKSVEESNFIDVLTTRPVILHVMDFLATKGFFPKNHENYKQILRSIWFDIYSRGGGIYGSSGFEHVFLMEMRRKKIIGFHNWIFFSMAESKKDLNYLGYQHQSSLSDTIKLASVCGRYKNESSKCCSMFIGTTPDVDMALYTLCFFVRPGKACKFTLGGKKIAVQTYVWKDNGKRLIASVFPYV